MFQSMNVLRSYSKKRNFTQHDYGDDLESILYVYTSIITCFTSSGKYRDRVFYDDLAFWKSDNAAISLGIKGEFLSQSLGEGAEEDVAVTWGRPYLTLMNHLRVCVNEIQTERSSMASQEGRKDIRHAQRFYSKADTRYRQFLGYFMAALKDIEDGSNAPSPSTPPPPQHIPLPISPGAQTPDQREGLAA